MSENLRRIDIAPRADGRGETHGWQAHYSDAGTPRTKLFSDSKHGGPEGARSAAQLWLLEDLRNVNPGHPRVLAADLELERAHARALAAANLELIHAFAHDHVGPEQRCASCGLDLQNSVHYATGTLHPSADAARTRPREGYARTEEMP